MRLFSCSWVLSLPVWLTLGVVGSEAKSLDLQVQSSSATYLAQATPTTSGTGCPKPVLSRLQRHKVAANETLESIAKQYNLLPTTLMGLNPSLRDGKAAVGTQIVVPPFNGIRVELKPGQTFRDVAKQYNVRSDVLFEVNGCQPNPTVVFIPGANWSPVATAGEEPAAPVERTILAGSPLPTQPSRSSILLGYGWKLQSTTGKVAFHSGVDLSAKVGTTVRAAGNGTIAFAGQQGPYGNLVVINHAEGLQTRYAQLGSIQVKVGQTVRQGQTIATVGISGRPSSKESHLHFEVRSRSNVGWVAENPETYLLKEPTRPSQAQR